MARRTDSAFDEHRTCLTLTQLSIDLVPRDGSLGRYRKVRKGAELWQPEDRADRIYFVDRGEMAIYSGDPRASDVLLQRVTGGEPFGELCFCAETGGIRNTVARASTDVRVLEIGYAAFLEYLRGSETVLSSLVCTLCIRLSECETRTEILAHRGAQERLGRLLLQLATKSKSRATAGTAGVIVRLSHAEIAGMGAMSRSHVTVTLGYFRRKQLIQYSHDRPLTVNVRALRAHVSSPPREGRGSKS